MLCPKCGYEIVLGMPQDSACCDTQAAGESENESAEDITGSGSGAYCTASQTSCEQAVGFGDIHSRVM